MNNNFVKQLGNTARDQAKQMAKQVAREPLEIFKETKSQAGLPKEINPQSGSSMIQEVMTGSGTVKELSPAEELNINSAAKSKLQEIEAELRRLRQEREQVGIDWAKKQQEIMKEPDQGKRQEFVMPSSGHKKGPRPQGGGQKKSGTQEVSRQAKG